MTKPERPFSGQRAASTRGGSLMLFVKAAPAALVFLASDLPFGDGQLVLVVEDDPLVREAVLQRLEV